MLSSVTSYLKERIEIKQAIKTALAAIVGLYLCLELDLLISRPAILISGLWCVVASIVVLQPYVGGTYKAIINRLLGVFIGSSIGALFIYLLGSNSIILGFAIFITIILCSLLNLKDSYRIAALSVAVIMIPWTLHPELSPWSFAFFRFLDTCLGILAAMIIAHTIWPSQAGLKARLNAARILDLLRQLWRSIFILTHDHQDQKDKIEQDLCAEIDRLLLQTRLIVDESKLESTATSLANWTEVIISLDRIFSDFYEIKNIFKEELEQLFDEALRKQTDETVEKIESSLKSLSLRITDWTPNYDQNRLDQLTEKLNEEQIRFRGTKATRQYEFEFIERYFVFFYSLKSILQQLIHLNKLIDLMQANTEAPS